MGARARHGATIPHICGNATKINRLKLMECKEEVLLIQETRPPPAKGGFG
jgi:hypothetical protein